MPPSQVSVMTDPAESQETSSTDLTDPAYYSADTHPNLQLPAPPWTSHSVLCTCPEVQQSGWAVRFQQQRGHASCSSRMRAEYFRSLDRPFSWVCLIDRQSLPWNKARQHKSQVCCSPQLPIDHGKTLQDNAGPPHPQNLTWKQRRRSG